jgi:hypothetical protein
LELNGQEYQGSLIDLEHCLSMNTLNVFIPK